MTNSSVARVVVVDDDAAFRSMLVALLEADGHTVIGEAANGADAVDLVARLRPDVVTMDLEMPVMSGAEATTRICASGDCPPVVIVSGSRSSEYLAAALTGGARWHVAKSDVAGELPAVVAALVAPATARS